MAKAYQTGGVQLMNELWNLACGSFHFSPILRNHPTMAHHNWWAFGLTPNAYGIVYNFTPRKAHSSHRKSDTGCINMKSQGVNSKWRPCHHAVPCDAISDSSSKNNCDARGSSNWDISTSSSLKEHSVDEKMLEWNYQQNLLSGSTCLPHLTARFRVTSRAFDINRNWEGGIDIY